MKRARHAASVMSLDARRRSAVPFCPSYTASAMVTFTALTAPKDGRWSSLNAASGADGSASSLSSVRCGHRLSAAATAPRSKSGGTLSVVLLLVTSLSNALQVSLRPGIVTTE